jgi:nucleoside 2-deoxyribosyltransferase
MKIYLATKFTHKDDFRKVAEVLEREGHEITHDWTQDSLDGILPEDVETYKMSCAGLCIMGVQAAEAVVLIAKPNMAGAFVEMGMAISIGIPVIVLGAFEEGNQSCLFYHLPDCAVFHHADSIDEVVAYLKPKENRNAYDDVIRLDPFNGTN